jgi:hypothetical protein
MMRADPDTRRYRPKAPAAPYGRQPPGGCLL